MDFLKVSFHCQGSKLEFRARCPGMLQMLGSRQQLYLGIFGDAWKIRHRMGGSPEVFREIG